MKGTSCPLRAPAANRRSPSASLSGRRSHHSLCRRPALAPETQGSRAGGGPPPTPHMGGVGPSGPPRVTEPECDGTAVPRLARTMGAVKTSWSSNATACSLEKAARREIGARSDFVVDFRGPTSQLLGGPGPDGGLPRSRGPVPTLWTGCREDPGPLRPPEPLSPRSLEATEGAGQEDSRCGRQPLPDHWWVFQLLAKGPPCRLATSPQEHEGKRQGLCLGTHRTLITKQADLAATGALGGWERKLKGRRPEGSPSPRRGTDRWAVLRPPLCRGGHPAEPRSTQAGGGKARPDQPRLVTPGPGFSLDPVSLGG